MSGPEQFESQPSCESRVLFDRPIKNLTVVAELGFEHFGLDTVPKDLSQGESTNQRKECWSSVPVRHVHASNVMHLCRTDTQMLS